MSDGPGGWALLTAMTLDEKASILTGDSAWTTRSIERVGLRSMRMADGPHGVRRTHRSGSMAFAASAATCFPTASASSATWDPALLAEMGRAIGREAIAHGVDVVLGPGVNMKRSPLCGRNFEYFSEDPYLAGRLAVGWIDGVQSQGVGASLKHYAVNNQESRRMSVSAEVDERTLREIYLPAFEMAVKESQPWTVMCAYNRVNGTYASEHRELLTDILRDEWGFEGLVVSDWAAVHDRPTALAAGLDLEMPGPRPRRVRSVVDAVQRGDLEETIVDEAVRRVVAISSKAGETPKGAPFDAAAHHRLARRIASEGMVLLRNDGILPLAREGRIAVIGRAAQAPRIQGGGSSQTTPTAIDIPFDELKRLAPDVDFSFSAGYEEDGRPHPALVQEAAARAGSADIALVFIALPGSKESEGTDRRDLRFTDGQVDLIGAVTSAQPRTVVVMFNGSAVEVTPWIDDTAAVLEAWYAGQAAGGAIADILFGEVDPGGRLAETFPIRLEDTPAYLNFPGDGDTVRYGEGIFIGYRWYDAKRLAVAFPFGFGLSYTTFDYADARVSSSEIVEGAVVTVSLDVTNRGDRAGTDVVQVYVRDIESSVSRPDKELAGFAKVQLRPGETATVAIEIDPRAFAYWDVPSHGWRTEPGRFEIAIGASSRDIRVTLEISVTASLAPASTLSDMSPLEDWLRDQSARPQTIGLLQELAPILGETFGDAAANVDELDPHFNSYFSTMPLRGVLEFAAPAGGPDPDLRLAELVGSVRPTRAQKG